MTESNPLTESQLYGYGQIIGGLGEAMSGGIQAANLNLAADQMRMIGNINAEEKLRIAARDVKRAENAKKLGIGQIKAQLAANGIVISEGSANDVMDAEMFGYDQKISDIRNDAERAAFLDRFTANAKADALNQQAKNAQLASILGGAVSIGFGMNVAGIQV